MSLPYYRTNVACIHAMNLESFVTLVKIQLEEPVVGKNVNNFIHLQFPYQIC